MKAEHEEARLGESALRDEQVDLEVGPGEKEDQDGPESFRWTGEAEVRERDDGGLVGRKPRVGRWLDMMMVWVFPYIVRGYRVPLEERDFPVNAGIDAPEFLAREAERRWQVMVKNQDKRQPSLTRLLLGLQGWEFYMGIALSIVQGLLFSVARPLFLREIIDIVSDENSTDKQGAVVAVTFALVILVEGIVQAQVKQLLSCRLGTRYISWMSSLLQRKASTVSAIAVSKAGLQESSLIGSDVTRMVEDWRWMCLLPYVCTALVGGVVILSVVLREASLVGFVIMFSIAFINFKLTKMIKAVEEVDFALGDKRIGILREILDGVKAIKMMAWEIPFRDLMFDARAQEASYIQRFRTLQVSSINLGRASPILAACFSILVLAIIDTDDLTASTIFVAISSFQGLRLPLIAIPQQTAMLANTFVSLKRLRRYLLLEDAPPPEPLEESSQYSVVVRDASFDWTLAAQEQERARQVAEAEIAAAAAASNPEHDDGADPETGAAGSSGLVKPFRLTDLTFSVKRHNHLVGVVGRVGSGKTSLLSSILGSMFLEKGSFKLASNVAYIPQRPFVMSGTLIENVLMGQPMDRGRFNKVLHASALDVDLENLPDGKFTEIGERGQTLSGGQAARLSIARALYHNADLLLIDDALAAVDPEVANNLFRRTVLGFLGRNDSLGHDQATSRRSVLMTLNQLHLLPSFDHVIVLDGGRIVEQGSYEELTADESSMLSSMLQGHESSSHEQGEETQVQKMGEGQLQEASEVKAPLDEAKSSAAKEVRIGSGSSVGTTSGPGVLLNDDDDEAQQSTRHILVAKEKAEKGAVAMSILGEYLKAMGKGRVPFSFLFAVIAYSFMAAMDLYLANWIQDSEDLDTTAAHLRRAAVYISLALCNVIGVEILSLHNTRSSVRASKHVHNDCINQILHAPITWYEETPSGRITSRFSGDLSMVDRQLAFIFDDCFQFFFLLGALSIVVCYIVPELVAVFFVGFALFGWQVVAVDRSNREAKRAANGALAPILTNVSETVNARDLIRCMKLEHYFCQKHFANVDRYTSNLYMSYTLVNFSTLVSGVVSFLLSSGAALVVVFRREAYDPALVGLAITYAMLTPYFLSILSVVLPIGFAALTSLERVVEYKGAAVPQEPAWYTTEDNRLLETGADDLDTAQRAVDALSTHSAANWPVAGEIEFRNVVLRYRPNLPPALKGLSFTIRGGEKVGICGRTGSGKSSSVLMLFRVHELTEGQILIDGQDISQIGLQLLRKSLTIIPQTPLLLRGSLRQNLDPFDMYTDVQLVDALSQVGLDPNLLGAKPAELNHPSPGADGKKKNSKNKKATSPSDQEQDQVDSGALSLSIGERQLLSLARAVLRQSLKIVVLDEPTSSLDMASDDAIQKVVRSAFAQSTVLTIAHRLRSIVDSDRIMVLDKGEIAEFDVPHALLQRPGTFAGMVDQLGPKSAADLRDRARVAFTKGQ
ncbi:Multidrug resistance-associated protein 1 (ATP-binding cassette sub-family C member 1) (Glutathione-S-conjugate-translocating ATPase ABCC1) (Leukotriene C(4) transporter) (LTC4 transporter) [Durusdinium trenchii]|uniref:Multidrug resistance-associated protein 1 (ATP-binding cassette sub-family C member 1) (Glutathione-S-conjugate-translocating ATPase ABCC1) (Leukotriene C(4) transporter) (LTC4 transporter) n=1 Tax=Durusdinium trenchii TaxID=1381693 RepID=A0ABP0RXV5_9DINO